MGAGDPVMKVVQDRIIKVRTCFNKESAFPDQVCAGFRAKCKLERHGRILFGSRFKVQSSRFKVQSSGFKVQSSGFKVHSSRFTVKGFGPF
jgi:hypothetical protein